MGTMAAPPPPPGLTARGDFETYSEAGYVWDGDKNKWVAPLGSKDKGLKAVGSVVYSEHPSTEVLVFCYRLPGGKVEVWWPDLPNPVGLFAYLACGGTFAAHNSSFEFMIWNNVCVPKYGWPPLLLGQTRCSMATASVNTYPAGLANLGDALGLAVRKDKEGKSLLDKFSVPRNPTKKDPRKRIRPEDDPEAFLDLVSYCRTDVLTEEEASSKLTPMTPDELSFWQIDQTINQRGIHVDINSAKALRRLMNSVFEKYEAECVQLTGGLRPSQGTALMGWLAANGVSTSSLDDEHLTELLRREDLSPLVRRVLDIRYLTSYASVKKLNSLLLQVSGDARLRNTLWHHGARTGRPTGSGPQPLNLPKDGPTLKWCENCNTPTRTTRDTCASCGAASFTRSYKWPSHPEGVEPPIERILRTALHCGLDEFEDRYGDPLLAISGCVRGLFNAAPGHDLIASDYSSIEAVVLAMLAGEQWRIDAFREGKPIYLLGASKITGKSLEYYLDYQKEHGDHHPDRQKIGKVSELASGFGGWIGSYKAFGSTDSDDEIKRTIIAWRNASPSIVEFWGGQWRGLPWDKNRRRELYGMEGMFIQALQTNQPASYRSIRFVPVNGDMRVYLPSGRYLTYVKPFLTVSKRDPDSVSINFWTENSNPKYGPIGWVPMETYGGRLTENVVQAVAHDILRHAIRLLEAAGYPVVLHVYDEIVCEVRQGFGSIEEMERLMSTMAGWCHDWPVKAAGGWRGPRFKKG